ncbi:hypothetical protein D3C80_2065700 [compost metagenome]
MHPPQHPLYRTRVVVLNEVYWATHHLIEHLLIEAFEEETSFIAKNLRLEEDNLRNGLLDCFHLLLISKKQVARGLCYKKLERS